MEVHELGTDAVLVEVDDAATAAALYAAVRALQGFVFRDVVPAARTVLVDGVADVTTLRAALADVSLDTAGAATGEAVEVPTVYDGADLDVVARLWDMTAREVVATHTGTDFAVAFCGFAPGFAYCTGLPERLAVPRRDDPRPRVPAGSVGLAGPFTGVYPSASPGGWQLIGRTDLVLWDTGRAQPATLPPGTRVRFLEA